MIVQIEISDKDLKKLRALNEFFFDSDDQVSKAIDMCSGVQEPMTIEFDDPEIEGKVKSVVMFVAIRQLGKEVLGDGGANDNKGGECSDGVS